MIEQFLPYEDAAEIIAPLYSQLVVELLLRIPLHSTNSGKSSDFAVQSRWLAD
jgi:hypothetical protein